MSVFDRVPFGRFGRLCRKPKGEQLWFAKVRGPSSHSASGPFEDGGLRTVGRRGTRDLWIRTNSLGRSLHRRAGNSLIVLCEGTTLFSNLGYTRSCTHQVFLCLLLDLWLETD